MKYQDNLTGKAKFLYRLLQAIMVFFRNQQLQYSIFKEVVGNLTFLQSCYFNAVKCNHSLQVKTIQTVNTNLKSHI